MSFSLEVEAGRAIRRGRQHGCHADEEADERQEQLYREAVQRVGSLWYLWLSKRGACWGGYLLYS